MNPVRGSSLAYRMFLRIVDVVSMLVLLSSLPALMPILHASVFTLAGTDDHRHYCRFRDVFNAFASDNTATSQHDGQVAVEGYSRGVAVVDMVS